MKKKHKNFVIAIAAALVTALSVSCSSAPKNSGDIFFIRPHAETLLESGKTEASRGNYENALIIINESKRNAILADDPSLIVRCCLSRGNVLFSLGRTDEAFAEWEQAIAEAQKLNNSELLPVSRIYYARGALVSGRTPARSVLDDVEKNAANIKSDQLNVAFSWQVRGLALRALGSYREAEDAVTRSLEIHEKNRYLENASYDWYTIASIRSLSGNTSGALEALEKSIAIDRRIENAWGLAASWRAMGDVYRKTGSEREALEAYNRAWAIYTALDSKYEIEETERRINRN